MIKNRFWFGKDERDIRIERNGSLITVKIEILAL